MTLSWVLSVGYGVGLTIAFIVLYISRTGQPALLYIVPAILLPLFIVSSIRKQFGDIWLGVVGSNLLT
jgi:hypothetical protein